MCHNPANPSFSIWRSAVWSIRPACSAASSPLSSPRRRTAVEAPTPPRPPAGSTTPSTTAVTPATTTTITARRHATPARARRHARRQAAAAPAPAAQPATGTAAWAQGQLPVKGRAPKAGYTREQFGDGWSDTAGCDTRDRVLTRDLTAKTYLDSCRVASGALADPYTAQRIEYTRGASEVDIDHVVALSDAWQKGAQQWTPERQRRVRQRPVGAAGRRRARQPLQGRQDAATGNALQQAVFAATTSPGRSPSRCTTSPVGHPG